MEKKVYSKLFITSMAFMFAVMDLFSQGAPPVTTVGTATFSAGTYSVPVTVAGFTNVGNISMTLNYDATKLIYNGVLTDAGLIAANLVTTPTTDQSGTFKMSYISSAGVVLADPLNTLFTLNFSPKPGVQGVTVPLTWSTIQGDCDVTPPSPGAFTPPISVTNMSNYFIGGSLQIAGSITGPTPVCNGSTGNIYSAPAGMTGYTWAVTGGGVITAGDGTQDITVIWTSAGVWSIMVSYTDPNSIVVTLPPFDVTVGPTITGPLVGGLPATLSGTVTGVVYTTEPGMTNYVWAVSSPAGNIVSGQGTESITVDWTNVTSQQSVSVNYTGPLGCTPSSPTVLIINYYPFAVAIDPTIVPKFVDPLPHFAAGLRVNAKAGGSITVKAAMTQQVALSTGTVLSNGTIGTTPGAGLGNYAGYAISTDGTNFGPTMWPAQTIETQQGHQLQVTYLNTLNGARYSDFNILADQTLMMNGYTLNGNPLIDPYLGPIPMVVHLHGGEMPSGSDGGPSAWFMPEGTVGVNLTGPTYQNNQSGVSTYPNQQEATTLWYHPHDDGLTRINVYTGLAGYYFLRGENEETAHLPGWSGDDKVLEITPNGKSPTFTGPPSPFFSVPTPYLPEVEIAVQDRMFNVKGELYWPVAPTNPDMHPFWTPEFVGDVMTVNGKSWPYLSVAPRKYRFRMLEGCNARFLNMWLAETIDPTTGATITYGPKITIIGGEGGLLASPETLDPALGQTLLMAPGQRYDVIIDFTGMDNKTFTLMNNANAPYPGGDPVVIGTTDRIMQFVVNGQMVSGSNPANPGTDQSATIASLVNNLRQVTPLVQLTDFAGHYANGVTPVVHREIILNEVTGAGGPAAVLVNNSYFDPALSINPADPYRAGGPTEIQTEGTIEKVTIINTTADAHPIHIHLLQWQLLSRQNLDVDGLGGSGTPGYQAAYNAAWVSQHPSYTEFPAGLGYPGGAGTPYPYNQLNGDNAIGGNPAAGPFLTGLPIPANPEERGWKDNVIVLPNQVTTFMVRVAPTELPVNTPQKDLVFPFDPSAGPGYVWHCHIVDHEDMSMMRPLMILPSAARFPQITTQPVAQNACTGDPDVTFSVSAQSSSTITYQWKVSTDNGQHWTNLADDAVYSGSKTATLHVVPAGLNGNQYQCDLTNANGVTISNAALLTVTDCQVSGTVKYNNLAVDALSGFRVTINGKSDITNGSGAFTVTGVTSGTHAVVVDELGKAPGAINSTDAGAANYWATNPSLIPSVRFMAGDVNNDHSITSADAQGIQLYFVLNQAFVRAPWQFNDAAGTTTTDPPALTVTVNGSSVSSFDILSLATGDFNGSFNPNAPAKGEEASGVRLLSGESMKVATGTKFELPVRAVNDMEVGAVSLILNLSSSLVDVQDVSIKGSNVPVTFNVRDNQLRIGWNSLAPVSVKAGEELITLKLRATAAFTEGESFEISMVEDPLNEIATGKFRKIDVASLKIDKVVATGGERRGDVLSITLYPSPVSGLATVKFTLPADGKVSIQVFNTIGAVVKTLVNESKTSGNYTMEFDASSMPQGIYMAKISLRGTGPEQVHTIRFVVNR